MILQIDVSLLLPIIVCHYVKLIMFSSIFNTYVQMAHSPYNILLQLVVSLVQHILFHLHVYVCLSWDTSIIFCKHFILSSDTLLLFCIHLILSSDTFIIIYNHIMLSSDTFIISTTISCFSPIWYFRSSITARVFFLNVIVRNIYFDDKRSITLVRDINSGLHK